MNPSRQRVAVRPLFAFISRHLAASRQLNARSYAASSQGHPRPRARSSSASGSPLAHEEGEVPHIDFAKEFKGRDDTSFPCLTRYVKTQALPVLYCIVIQALDSKVTSCMRMRCFGLWEGLARETISIRW